jgi:molybdate transport system substrate-binding protein
MAAGLLQAGLALGLPAAARAQPGEPVRVAAASDLKFVLSLLLARFQSDTGQRVEASFGSSGSFARQIQQGLPVELFMSADEALVFQLADAGLTRSGDAAPAVERGVLYAVGRIALYLPRNSPIALDAELKGLQAQWPQVRKFAIANPEHAPYGRAAREALQQLGLWELVLPKLVLGENISQATQFVATGAAQAGITALAHAGWPAYRPAGQPACAAASAHGAA